jgi:hypothetical protein
MKTISRRIACCFFLFITASNNTHAQRQVVFTTDIDHFWNAYDTLQTTNDTMQQVAVMQSLYVDKGTDGLKEFMKLRKFDAGFLAASIRKYPKFWRSIRANTLTIPPKVPAINAYIAKLKKLYPECRPATLYFTIAGTRAAGVTQDSMALIGAEITMGNKYTEVSEFPDKRLANFFATQSTDNIIPVTIHEYVHTQQRTESSFLLGECIYEGACDFIAELVIGKPLTNSYLVYGRSHEQQLKQQFRQEMLSTDFSNWLYNGATTNTMGDLGYFMGYTISKAYYQQAGNKPKATKDIITLNYADLSAVQQFLADSKYYDAEARSK